MMYKFCETFKVSPEVYYKQKVNDVDILLLINKEVETLKNEEEERRAGQNA